MPKILFHDNGKEFTGEPFQNYLTQQGIKSISTQSYTPQPDVENMNGQIRKMISQNFILNKKNVWIHNLQQIEDNLNNYNALIKREPPPKNETKREPKYKKGDTVRISMKIISSDVRKAYKSGLMKHIHVKWSIDVYIVDKTYKPTTNNGFYKYALRNSQGDRILNTDNTISRFRESDLMQIPEDTETNMDEKTSNKINQI